MYLSCVHIYNSPSYLLWYYDHTTKKEMHIKNRIKESEEMCAVFSFCQTPVEKLSFWVSQALANKSTERKQACCSLLQTTDSFELWILMSPFLTAAVALSASSYKHQNSSLSSFLTFLKEEREISGVRWMNEYMEDRSQTLRFDIIMISFFAHMLIHDVFSEIIWCCW